MNKMFHKENDNDRTDSLIIEDSDYECETQAENRLKELLEMQIAECEMIQSMFPRPDELILEHDVLADIQCYVSGKTSKKPPQLNFTVNLTISELKLEVNIILPSFYPFLKPETFVRSSQFKREQQKAINKALTLFISSLENNEIIIGTIIEWLQENALNFFKSVAKEVSVDPNQKLKESEFIFTRLWIYSHHIYSKSKRKIILQLANDYKLTGFCLPGKPGIICLEGHKTDCEEWWAQIKSMTWKKIMCLKREEIIEFSDLDELRKFTNFKEISFNTSKIKKQGHHMDFGEFYKFLKNNDCDYIFKTYFGMDGQ